MRRTGRRAAWLVATFAILAAGCGGGDDNAVSVPHPTTTEIVLAKLPQGWERRVDTTVGYSLGLPPGFHARDADGATLIRFPDHLVAISLSADRTLEALDGSIDEFATRALASYAAPLEPSPSRPFSGTPLEAVSTHTVGIPEGGGASQRITLIVLRREGAVTYTAVVASDARRVPAAERRYALRIVRTLRDYPIGAPVSPSNGA